MKKVIAIFILLVLVLNMFSTYVTVFAAGESNTIIWTDFSNAKYEIEYGSAGKDRVKISGDIIKKAVKLSERYITDRFLPDKAIDLLDESCASAALRNLDLEEYDKIKFEIESLEKEQEDLLLDKENIDYEKLANVRYKLSSLNDKLGKKSKNCLSATVEDNDLAHVIEIWTGIPSSKIQENQFVRNYIMLYLKKYLYLKININ